MTLNKKEWCELAEAVTSDEKMMIELDNAKREINKKYGMSTDFVGCDYWRLKTLEIACNLLGDGFEFFLYECDGDWKEYNRRVTHKDGSHPKCKNFADLYDEEVAEETVVEEKKSDDGWYGKTTTITVDGVKKEDYGELSEAIRKLFEEL